MTEVVFDVSNVLVWGWMNPLISGLVAIGALQELLKTKSISQKIASTVAMLVFASFSVFCFYGAMSNLSRAKQELASGDFQTTQGEVTFTKVPNPLGDSKGSFIVDGITFNHTYFAAFGGYSNNCFLGCDVQLGDKVEISHKHGRMLKVTILKKSHVKH